MCEFFEGVTLQDLKVACDTSGQDTRVQVQQFRQLPGGVLDVAIDCSHNKPFCLSVECSALRPEGLRRSPEKIARGLARAPLSCEVGDAMHVNLKDFGRVPLLVAASVPIAVSLALLGVVVAGLASAESATSWSTLAAVVAGRSLISAVVVGGALMVMVPLGVAISVFLSEYCAHRSRRRIVMAFEVAAAIPTVVWGYFALDGFAATLAGVGFVGPRSMMGCAALAVGLMALPTFVVLAVRALIDVPETLRESAYSLGSDRLATSRRIVIPAAASGLLSAFVLALSRAFGEVMIVLVVTGYRPGKTLGAGRMELTLPAAIAGSAPEALTPQSDRYLMLFSMALTVLVLSVITGVLSHWVTPLRERSA